jgi:iron-sulfur cluster insertion protein
MANPRPDPIQVTDSAVKRIRQIIAHEDQQGLKLRLSVSGGGCSGFQYNFALDDKSEPGDIDISRDDVTVTVDSMSLMYVLGSELDFVEDLTGSYFRVNNPNAASSCGCGTSFSI